MTTVIYKPFRIAAYNKR